MSLPFALVRHGSTSVPLLIGRDGDSLTGFDCVDLKLYKFEPDDVIGVISDEPAAVYFGATLAWKEQQAQRAAENVADRSRKITIGFQAVNTRTGQTHGKIHAKREAAQADVRAAYIAQGLTPDASGRFAIPHGEPGIGVRQIEDYVDVNMSKSERDALIRQRREACCEGCASGGACESTAVEDARPKLVPRGYKFTPVLFDDASGLPVTGYSEVRATLLRHRAETPTLDTIRLSALFAVSTVRTSIEDAERSFLCFHDLYAPNKQIPDIDSLRGCFRGLQNTKSKMFSEVAAYAGTIQAAIESGKRDAELRRFLVRETDLPTGLGVAKTSFTLALFGHDVVCLDARILGRMYGSADAGNAKAKGWEKRGARLSDRALARYEAVEDSFLQQNPFYRPNDPIGKARAQYMAWESVPGVGGTPKLTTHSVWLNVVR